MTSPRNQQELQMLQGLLKKGFDELNKGNVREAAACCQKAIHIKPDLVPAHFLVGLVALESKDRKTACQAFGSVTKLQDNHPAAWAHLASIYMKDGLIAMADHALSKAEEHKSDDPLVLNLLGSVYSKMDEHDKALSCFEKANELQPNHPPYMMSYANNLIYHGKTEESEELLKQVIKKDPYNSQAHWSLSGSKKAKDKTHIELMKEYATHERLSPRGKTFFYYAIGKECEDLKLWDEAFEAFEKGANFRRETVEFDEQAEINTFKFLEDHYTNAWYDSLPAGNPAPSPIFVCGQPRTGTTLVERIITSHSQAHSAGELQQLGLAVRRVSKFQDPKRFSPEFFKAAMTCNPEKIGNAYIHATQKLNGGLPRFVDKLPQNYMMIPIILKALPNAKIIHLTRNPMDACFASYKQLFADAYLHSYDQAEMARHHARYRKLMDIWRERFPGQFFDISYEDTARNLEPNARALIEYLDLPWEDACLNFHQQDSAVSTASSVQVREPAHTRSIGRWKKYENQLTTMINTLREEGVPID